MNTKLALKKSNLEDWAELFENLGASSDNLADALSTAFSDEASDEIKMTAIEKFTEEATLTAIFHFRKFIRDETLYRLSKYEAVLTDCCSANPEIRQHFYNIHCNIVTLREAFNLMQGRYVKTSLYTAPDSSYDAWMKLNLKERDGQGNYKVETYRSRPSFNLPKLLALYPIAELDEPGFDAFLTKSLEQGNSEIVTFRLKQKTEKMVVAANPFNQTLSIYPLNRLAKKYSH